MLPRLKGKQDFPGAYHSYFMKLIEGQDRLCVGRKVVQDQKKNPKQWGEGNGEKSGEEQDLLFIGESQKVVFVAFYALVAALW